MKWFSGKTPPHVNTEDKLSMEDATIYLSAIIESSEDAIIGKTLDGTVTSWNKAAERIFGYTKAEIIGKSISVLISPELHDEESKILEKLKKGERVDHMKQYV